MHIQFVKWVRGYLKTVFSSDIDAGTKSPAAHKAIIV